MPALLRYMAEGMRDKINDLMAPKYNGQVFDLPPGDPKRLNYREHSATSDPIERYFGKASYLRKANPNQLVWHLNNMMAITETNFGTRLVNTLNTDPDEFHRIMDACRKHRPAFENTAREWEQTAARTIMTNLRQFLLDSQKKKVDAAVELARLEQLAEDFEFPATAAAQAVHRVELLSGLVKKHEQMLTDVFSMFIAVHQLETVPELEYIFFYTNDQGKKFKGLKSQNKKKFARDELVDRYLTCGIYLLPDNVQARAAAAETQARATAEAAAAKAAAASDAAVAAEGIQGSGSSDGSAAVQQHAHQEPEPEPVPEPEKQQEQVGRSRRPKSGYVRGAGAGGW